MSVNIDTQSKLLCIRHFTYVLENYLSRIFDIHFAISFCCWSLKHILITCHFVSVKKKWMTFHCVFLKFRLLPQLSFQLKKLCYRRWNCKSSIFEKTCTEVLARWWSVKNVFLTPAACNFIKKETPLQVFSCKFRYIFLKHHFLYVTWGDCFFSSRSLINIMI